MSGAISRIVHCVVEGNPISWKRARRNGNRYFPCPKESAYRKAIAETVSPKWIGGATKSPFIVEVYVSLPYKKDGGQRSRRSDVDNYAKVVMDALEGVVWENDRQVRTVSAQEVSGCNDGAMLISITELADDCPLKQFDWDKLKEV